MYSKSTFKFDKVLDFLQTNEIYPKVTVELSTNCHLTIYMILRNLKAVNISKHFSTSLFVLSNKDSFRIKRFDTIKVSYFAIDQNFRMLEMST